MTEATEIQKRLLALLRERDRNLRVTWNAEKGAVTHLSGALTQPGQGEPEEIAWRFVLEHQALLGIEDADKELAVGGVKADAYGWQHVTFQQRVGDVPVWSSVVQVHLSTKGEVRTVSSSYRPAVRVDPVPRLEPWQAIEIAAKDAQVEPREPERSPFATVYVYEGEPHLAWVVEAGGWIVPIEGGGREPAEWQYFVDAHDGKVIARFSLIHTHLAPTGQGESVSNPPRLTQTTKTFNVSHSHGPDVYRLNDTTRHIEVYDAAGDVADAWGNISGALSEDNDNDWDDTTGMASTNHAQRINCQSAEVDAHDLLARVYDYYLSKFGRSSLDGAGMTIKAYVHVRTVDNVGNTIAYDNAYWSTRRRHLAFGDGSYTVAGSPWRDNTFYSGALDIVAHEFTHGVTAFEITDAAGNPNGFTYLGESGAANEMFSDVFAAFLCGDWRQGDEIVVGNLTAAGHQWRDLANPTRGLAYDPNDTINQFLAKGVPQPDHYDIRYQGPNDQYHDWGGVHINSGILNFACYLATHGGVSHRAGRTPEAIRVYRKDRLGIGVEHAEQIYYLALTGYFNGAPGVGDNLDATFREVRQAVLDACDQLRVDAQYGVDQCDWNTLNTAFYAVGLHPVGVHYGPDPMITPWGIWTGDGPSYQSPDIWCRDAAGTHVNAEKATVNRLVAQIHNIGDQPANGVTVRFFYAPCGFGYHHTDFKLIDVQTIDLLSGETRTVEVDWDLTDLGEDHGGLWPHPVGDFDHFCVRVDLVTNEENDVNTCNNRAQHNFFDVGTAQDGWGHGMLVIATPFEEREDWMALHIHTTLPRGWLVLFDGNPLPKRILLNPREKRVVKVEIQVPDRPLIEWPIDGTLVGKVADGLPGKIDARLDEVTRIGEDDFEGRLRGRFDGEIVGRLEAQIAASIVDTKTGELEGKLQGMVYELESGKPFEMKGKVHGWLTPERRVSVGGQIGGEDAGGVDFNLVLKR